MCSIPNQQKIEMKKFSKTKLNNSGFSHFETALCVIVITVVASVGIFVYNKNNNQSKADSADSVAVIDDTPGDVPTEDVPTDDEPAPELPSDIAPISEITADESTMEDTPSNISTSRTYGRRRTDCYASVVVLDPGHSPTKNSNSRDSFTGLYNMDYSNSPEMRNAWIAALKTKVLLTREGYRVALTKRSANEKINLTERAQRANRTYGRLLITLHSDPGGASILMYPDGNSKRIPKGSSRKDRNNGLVHPSIAPNSEYAAKKMAPIIQKGLGIRYQAKSYYEVYGKNRLGGNGKNYGNTPVQTILSSIPEVYSEVPQNVLPSDQFARTMAKAIRATIQPSTCR